jgi:hypothetical protein
MDIPARISDYTTAMIVVFLLSSYEESANMSRCILNRREPPVKRNDKLSSPHVHEFLVGVFAEASFRLYNVLCMIP